MDEIVNKVAQSGLITIDLAEFKPLDIVELDIAPQLWQGMVLKETDFREWVKTHDWSVYSGKNVCVFCSEDAIIPAWAFMLVVSQLTSYTKKAIVGTISDLEKEVIQSNIQTLNKSDFIDKRIVVKGCSEIPHQQYALGVMVNWLQSEVKSIMFGEPCSTVPIYKKKK
jgi:hypothetical protein